MKWFIALFIYPALSGATNLEVRESDLPGLIQGSDKVQASALESDASETRQQGILARSFLPSLDLYGGNESFKRGDTQWKTEPTYGAELKLNIYNGGKDQLADKSQDYHSQSKKIVLKRTQIEALTEARLAFWNLLFLQEKKAALQASLQLNQKNIAAAERRIQSGVAADSDRAEFQMQEVDLKRSLDELDLIYRFEQKRFSLILGATDKTVTPIGKLTHDHDIEKGLQISEKETEFNYQAEHLKAEQIRIDSRKEGREWWPSVDLFASYNQYTEQEREYPDAEDRRESAFGVRFSMSLPQGLKSHQESKALFKESQALEILSGLQKKRTALDVETLQAQLRFLHAQVHDAEENILRAERYYKTTQSEYTRGVKNSPDVLGASEKLHDRRIKYLEILRDFQDARAKLLALAGK